MEYTNLKLLPVCNCGQVIPDFLVEFSTADIDSVGLKYSYMRLDPAVCPNCKRHIESLQVDQRYVNLIRGVL